METDKRMWFKKATSLHKYQIETKQEIKLNTNLLSGIFIQYYSHFLVHVTSDYFPVITRR